MDMVMSNIIQGYSATQKLQKMSALNRRVSNLIMVIQSIGPILILMAGIGPKRKNDIRPALYPSRDIIYM